MNKLSLTCITGSDDGHSPSWPNNYSTVPNHASQYGNPSSERMVTFLKHFKILHLAYSQLIIFSQAYESVTSPHINNTQQLSQGSYPNLTSPYNVQDVINPHTGKPTADRYNSNVCAIAGFTLPKLAFYYSIATNYVQVYPENHSGFEHNPSSSNSQCSFPLESYPTDQVRLVSTKICSQ